MTIIEILIVVSIMMLTSAIALPAMNDISERNQAAAGINWIIRAVRMTRATAIRYNALTTLCPTVDRRQCGGSWHHEVMIFTDHNNDRIVNGNDHIAQVMAYPYEGSTIKWRAFRNRQYLQMTSLGMTNFQNGNFVYCAKNGDPRFARQIVLNVQGRVRKSYDRNGDGLVEDRYGDHLRC